VCGFQWILVAFHIEWELSGRLEASGVKGWVVVWIGIDGVVTALIEGRGVDHMPLTVLHSPHFHTTPDRHRERHHQQHEDRYDHSRHTVRPETHVTPLHITVCQIKPYIHTFVTNIFFGIFFNCIYTEFWWVVCDILLIGFLSHFQWLKQTNTLWH
jgi:hypothetical protein